MYERIDLAGGSRPWTSAGLTLYGNDSFDGDAQFSVNNGDLNFWGTSRTSGGAVNVSLRLNQILADLGLDVTRHTGIRLEIVDASFMEYALVIARADGTGTETRYDFAVEVDSQHTRGTVLIEIPWANFKPICTKDNINGAELQLIAKSLPRNNISQFRLVARSISIY